MSVAEPIRSTASRSLINDAWRGPSHSTLVATSVAIVFVLLAIGVLIFWRRLVGALDSELPRDAMLALAIATTATLACTRLAWRRSFPLDDFCTSRRSDLFVGWGSSLALMLLAVGCCYPANHTSDWMIWLPLLVADQFWRQSFFDAGDPEAGLSEAPLSVVALRNDDPNATTRRPEDLVQQLFRVRDDDGCEVIYGTLRADFQPGQRTATLHVGFCPPLAYLPTIEAEPLPGTPGTIKVVQALAHGARLDFRLAVAAEGDCHVWIDIAATPAGEKPQELRA